MKWFLFFISIVTFNPAFAADYKMLIKCGTGSLGVSIIEDYDGVRATVFAGAPRSHIVMTSHPIRVSTNNGVIIYSGPKLKLSVARDKSDPTKGKGELRYQRPQAHSPSVSYLNCKLY